MTRKLVVINERTHFFSSMAFSQRSLWFLCALTCITMHRVILKTMPKTREGAQRLDFAPTLHPILPKLWFDMRLKIENEFRQAFRQGNWPAAGQLPGMGLLGTHAGTSGDWKNFGVHTGKVQGLQGDCWWPLLTMQRGYADPYGSTSEKYIPVILFWPYGPGSKEKEIVLWSLSDKTSYFEICGVFPNRGICWYGFRNRAA